MRRIIDKMGFLLYDTELEESKRLGKVAGYDFDWSNEEQQQKMREYLDRHPEWLIKHKDRIAKEWLIIIDEDEDR